MKIFGEMCASNNLNCDDFSDQAAAQQKYDACAAKIANDNNLSAEKLRSVDVYGLDRDKD